MIEAYEAGEVYGTKEFAGRVYSTRAIGELLIKVNGNWVLHNYIVFWLLFYVITGFHFWNSVAIFGRRLSGG